MISNGLFIEWAYIETPAELKLGLSINSYVPCAPVLHGDDPANDLFYLSPFAGDLTRLIYHLLQAIHHAYNLVYLPTIANYVSIYSYITI